MVCILIYSQYPLCSAHLSYDTSGVVGARVKSRQQKMEIDVAISTHGEHYSRSRGEQMVRAVNLVTRGTSPPPPLPLPLTVKRLYFVGCKFRVFRDFHFNREIYFIKNQRFAMPHIDSPKIAKITFANHVLQAGSRNI